MFKNSYLKQRIKRLFQTKMKSRREKWDDAIVIGFMFYVIPACTAIALSDDLQIQPYSVTFPKPNNHDRDIKVVLNFYSATFGASDRIHVYMTIKPDDLSKQEYAQMGSYSQIPGVGLPPHYYLVFAGSICDPRESIFQDMFKETVSCQIKVPYVESERVYKNNAYFTYPVSGRYHVLLADQELDSMTKPDEGGFLQIEPIESYISYRNTKALMVLTIIGTYLGVVGIYFQWRQSI